MFRTAALGAAIVLWGMIVPAAAQPARSFRFGAAGDFDRGDRFKATVAAVKASKPDFLIALGDLAYAGAETEAERAWCDSWKTAGYKNVLLIAGNNDSNIDNYIEYCPKPGSPVPENYGKQYYFDYPASEPLARFILVVPGLSGAYLDPIDTNYGKGHPGYDFTVAAIDDARSKGIEWIFVAMHNNYISVIEKWNEVSTDTNNTFMTMLLDKRVDVILQGHEHGYERSKQLATVPQKCPVLVPETTFNAACVMDSDDSLVKGAGTVIHVIGTGGRQLGKTINTSDKEYKYFARVDNTTYGFGEFTVTPTTVSFTFRPSSPGKLVDSYVITKSTPPPAGPDPRDP